MGAPPSRAGFVVLGLAVALIVAVVVLAVTTFNANLASEGSQPPPPLPPLTELPAGRGLDWSRAGYADGQSPLPSPPATLFAADFGATGDGVTDDTQALWDALEAAAAAPDGGVLLLGPGTFVLTAPLVVASSNVTIRGSGEEATTLFVPISLSDAFPGSWDGGNGSEQSPWVTRGAFISFAGKRPKSSDRSTLLATVAGAVEQGANVVPVDTSSEFRLGQWVRLTINDASTEEPSPAQVVEPSAPTDTQVMAAQAGSIADWVYGDGLADSGAAGALGRDNVAFTARVASIGEGWVALDRPLPFPVKARWSGVLQLAQRGVQGSGIEQLTLRFNHTLMEPHLRERGYNALELANVAHCWIRQVTVLNADSAVRLMGADHCTVADVTAGVTEARWAPGGDEVNGHHGIGLSKSHANLIIRFRIAAPFYHDVSLEGGSLLNVVADGGGADLNLDLHRSGPWGNLFSLQPARSARRRLAGGSEGGEGGGAQVLALPPCDFGALLNFVGRWAAGDRCEPQGWLVAGLPADKPELYTAQGAARRAAAANATA